MTEVEQPTISLPDKKDPYSWAQYGKIHYQWLKHVAPQLGLNTQRLLLGAVLGSIIGDDANVFGYYFPDSISVAKDGLLKRLDWEIESAELPERFKERLKEVKEIVSGIDWSSQEGWQKAKDVWTDASKWVREEVKNDPELLGAIEYKLEKGEILSPHYQEFLYGEESIYK